MIHDDISDRSVLGSADFRRDSLEASFSCPTCKAPDPVRIDGRVCSECATFDRCEVHGRWTFSEFGQTCPQCVVSYTTLRTCAFCERRPEDHMVVSDGKVEPICDTCWQRALDEMDQQREGLGGLDA
jgi:hypothetical protein